MKESKCPVCLRADEMRFEIKQSGRTVIKVCCWECIKRYAEKRLEDS